MKQYSFLVLSILICLLMACVNSSQTSSNSLPFIKVNSAETGYVYLDGQFTGYKTPIGFFINSLE